MPYLVYRLHLCYFTGGGIEGQDLVGCALGYQLKGGFSMGKIQRFKDSKFILQIIQNI